MDHMGLTDKKKNKKKNTLKCRAVVSSEKERFQSEYLSINENLAFEHFDVLKKSQDLC